MYTTHFDLNSKLFKQKNINRFYHNVSFDAACADILDGIRKRRGFILLTGEAGVGKTFILRRCMADGADIRFVPLANPNLDFPDILSYLCTSLNLPVEHLDAEQQNRLFLDTLAAWTPRDQPIALLIDDAHHLHADVLGRLWNLVETPGTPGQGLRVVLAGLPAIEDTLRQPELRPLGESILTRCHLDRLSDQETELFISHQFEAAGRNASELLSPGVVDHIAAYCQGVPRTIAMLCDTVLLLAGLEAVPEITPDLVDDAALNCFLGEKNRPAAVDAREVRRAVPSAEPLPAAAGDIGIDLDVPELDLEFGLVERAMAALPPVAPPPDQDARSSDDSVADRWESELAVALAGSPPRDEFAQLLDDLVAKPDRGDGGDREALRHFRDGYARLPQDGGRAGLEAYRQRVARLAETRQPVLVSLASALKASSERDGVLCALVINPTWWLYREVRLRLRSPDLVFANDGQAPPLRLLDGRDARLVYLDYRYPGTGPVRATLWLELDLLDHRGEWRAWDNRHEIRLDPYGRDEDDRGPVAGAEPLFDGFPVTSAGLDATARSSPQAGGASGPVCTLPLELDANRERTHSLSVATRQSLGRGTPLTRALLLTANPAQAPARIEIVSRPFMIFGRHGAATDSGFGDFNLGFVPKYNRISRLHCVVCALGDQLALMPASDQGQTYTGRNNQRLERGRWEILETGDILNVCDLYRLKLNLVWERRGEGDQLDWNPQEPRDRFGRYLLELVDVLKQRDQQSGTDELRATLRNRYINLLRMQDRVAEVNGVGNPGSLLHARFERMDAARQRIVHYYVPKWLSLGSSPEAGLCISAEDVAPRHADLLFRDGMYWIQNLAGPGSVRIGCHGLATNEVLALEAGDELMIGAARFAFEAY
jgi:type II secretory pathway predicted ATPase ExeA